MASKNKSSRYSKGEKAIGLNHYRRQNARIVNSKKFPNSCLYFIKIKNMDLVKIGVSQNPRRRERDICNALPFNAELVRVYDIQNAYEFEEFLHNQLENRYLKSEWFEISDIELKEIYKEIDNCLTI